LKARNSGPVAAGRLELVHTATPGERDREQDMGFPNGSVMPQSMEALHGLEGMSSLHSHSTHWLERAPSPVLATYNMYFIVLIWTNKNMCTVK
jgi:hypothetical protein